MIKDLKVKILFILAIDRLEEEMRDSNSEN